MPQQQILDSADKALRDNANFGSLLSHTDRQFLIRHGQVRNVAADEVICRQHEQDRRVFVLMMGEVLIAEEIQGVNVPLATLKQGELFGEISALFEMPRIATVTAAKPGVVLEIPGKAMAELIARQPSLCEAVMSRYRSRAIHSALRAVPIFRCVSDGDLRELIDAASLVTIPRGATMVKEGELGDGLYLIHFGVAYVRQGMEGKPLTLAVLRRGDYFGEWSALTGAPRAASVSTLTQVEAVHIENVDFLAFLSKHPKVRDAVDLEAHKRRSQTIRVGEMPARGMKAVLSQLAEAAGIIETENDPGPAKGRV